MNSPWIFALLLLALTVAVLAALRSRHYAKQDEAAAEEAVLASHRAHDSAMEAEQSANRAEEAAQTACAARDASIARANQHLGR